MNTPILPSKFLLFGGFPLLLIYISDYVRRRRRSIDMVRLATTIKLPRTAGAGVTPTRCCTLILALVHHLIHRGAYPQYLCLTSFLQVASNEQLVENVVCLVEIKNDVQLAHIAEIPIQDFYEQMDLFQYNQFVVIFVDTCHKVKGCISLVDDLFVLPFDKIAHLWRSCQHSSCQLSNCTGFLLYERSDWGH